MSMNKMLTQPVTVIKGIGQEIAKDLETLQIYTVNDLIEYFPYRYEDYSLKNIHEAKHEERITVYGRVHSEPSLRYYGKNKSRLQVRLLVDNVLITAVLFNRAFLKNRLGLGQEVTMTGKWDRYRQTLTVSDYHFGKLERENVVPIYSVKGNLTSKQLQKFIKKALTSYGQYIEETLPAYMLSQYKLLTKREAIYSLHYPKNAQLLKYARRRMVYEEFLLFQLKMQAYRKFSREHGKGKRMNIDVDAVNEFIRQLPFSLTNAQKRVVDEILADLQSEYRMNRLLQGDVGSGKTIVAAITMYAAVTAGYQAALMVPTEILAEQHAELMKSLFQEKNLYISLLTSSVKGKKRKEELEKIAFGHANIIIGTHALIQEDVCFQRLGYVITDEQHRFGVEQRRILREKGKNPDVLFMTATPIPRTLAISLFGDMDVSVIDEMPAGRKKVETYWVKHDMFERVLQFIEKELQKGRQAYVICPLIEESEKLDVQNAIDIHTILAARFPQYSVGLMHGRLSASEKEDVMAKFYKNEYQILVSTTVVEVGVNVPNATVMLIYDAERFGLAQLHQLRGRVGRGEHQSYCILLADPKNEVGKERMRIMTETTDGFQLSEYDLKLRGPGDFFGYKQSGLPDFKFADVVHDYRALEVARQDAHQLICSEQFWTDEQYRFLREYLEETGVMSGEKLD